MSGCNLKVFKFKKMEFLRKRTGKNERGGGGVGGGFVINLYRLKVN
jgi:hypothetical protein